MILKLQGIAWLTLLLPSCGLVVHTDHDVATSLQSGSKTNQGVRPEVSVLGADETTDRERMLYAFSPVVAIESGEIFRLSLGLMWKGVPEREVQFFGDTATKMRLRPTPAEEWPTPPPGIEAKVASVVRVGADGSRHPIPLVIKSDAPGGSASSWQRLQRDGIEYSSAKPFHLEGTGDQWLELTISTRIKSGSVRTIRQKWKLGKSTERGFYIGPKSI